VPLQRIPHVLDTKHDSVLRLCSHCGGGRSFPSCAGSISCGNHNLQKTFQSYQFLDFSHLLFIRVSHKLLLVSVYVKQMPSIAGGLLLCLKV